MGRRDIQHGHAHSRRRTGGSHTRLLLVAGGLLYTFGAILYGLGIKHRYMHSIFHIFVILGSLAHFFCIVLYVL